MNSRDRRTLRRKFIECKRCGEQVSWNCETLSGICRNIVVENLNVSMNNNDGERDSNGRVEYEHRLNNRINIINNSLRNQGFIEEVKHRDSIRIMAVNPSGFWPDSVEKVEMMCQEVIDMEIDMIQWAHLIEDRVQEE